MAYVGPVEDSRRYTVPVGARPAGSGGQGFVYRATRTADGAPVALKCLTRLDLDDWGRVVHRARLVAQVAHPALGRHLDAFLGPHPFMDEAPSDAEFDEAYLVAAWVEGRELTEAVPGADLVSVMRWVRAVGLAADALHRHPVPGGVGIVHRDIKPSNVIVGPAGAVLVDLGVARPTDGSTATVGVGSPGWLPPEAYDDPAAVGPRSELWQVAGLAWWAVDGQPPGRRAAAGRHRRHVARVLAGRGVARPRRLAAHIDAGLAPRPDDRPSDLRRWCDDLVALAAASPAPRLRRPVPAAAAIAVAAVLVTGAEPVPGASPDVGLIDGNVLSHQAQDFENGPGVGAAWRATPENPALVRRTGDAHRGDAALQVTVPSGLTGFALPGIRTDVLTGPDRTVTARGAVRGLDATAPVYVLYRFYDPDDDPIGGVESPPVTGSATRSWSAFSGTPVRTPAGTARVEVAVGVLSNTGGHRYLFDHLAVSIQR